MWRTIVVSFLILVSGTSLATATLQSDEERNDADSPGLVIEASAGWDSTVDVSSPVPISLLLSNMSSAFIEGDLILSDPVNGTEVRLGEVMLAPQSTRRFAAIRDLSDSFECFVTLKRQGEVLWRRELPINTGQSYQVPENFALLVDDGGRRLIVPPKNSQTIGAALGGPTVVNLNAGNFGRRRAVAGAGGRGVKNLNVKSWQLPDHPGPLLPIQAIIFPEAAPVKDINAKQWQALARWVCQGGTVFVHAESADVVEKLTTASPLTFQMAGADETSVVRNIGLGSIREYKQPLFSSEGNETRQQISDAVGLLGEPTIRDFVASTEINRYEGQTQAQLNRVYVAGFFGIYTLLSGVFALMMFRFSKRKMTIYILTVVMGGCIAAAVLGGVLRASSGDLRWVTVTKPGAGGLVQVSRIEVQSAGGRTDAVGIKGPNCDLQYTGRIEENYSYYWSDSRPALPPYNWMANAQGPTVTDAYSVRVGMTPWGRRQLEGVGFKSQPNQLGFKLQYEKNAADEHSNMPLGQFSADISNPTSLQFSQAWLVIGVSRRVSENADVDSQWNQYGQQIDEDLTDGLVDVYHTEFLDLPASGGTKQISFEGNFSNHNNYWDYQQETMEGSFDSHRIGRMGTAKAWIIARLVQSPVLKIDTAETEFVPQEELHLFVQEILPENMPAAEMFLGPAIEPAEPEGAAEEAATPDQ